MKWKSPAGMPGFFLRQHYRVEVIAEIPHQAISRHDDPEFP
jgi:hypothetical protein